MAAGLAALEELAASDAYAKLEQLGAALPAGMGGRRAAGVPMQFQRCGSLFCGYFTAEPGAQCERGAGERPGAVREILSACWPRASIWRRRRSGGFSLNGAHAGGHRANGGGGGPGAGGVVRGGGPGGFCAWPGRQFAANWRHARLAIDHGSRRIGIAVSDELKLIAQPLEFIPAEPFTDFLARLQELLREKEVELILVGLPRNMDGDHGRRRRGAEVRHTAAGACWRADSNLG